MLKKRLIFTLLVSNGEFQLSRNFNLQKVGNLNWLYDCYNLEAIFKSIDELVILNVSRSPIEDQSKYLKLVETLSKNCFVPIALGGGIRSLEDAYAYMNHGADKLVIGQTLFNNPKLVKDLVSIFGGQSIVAALDYSKRGEDRFVVIENGKKETGLKLDEALRQIEALGVGELMLTSVERDGTGQGYDLDSFKVASENVSIPIIATGGVGKFVHFFEGLSLPYVSAANTANIFNFMMNGLVDARVSVETAGISLAHWSLE